MGIDFWVKTRSLIGISLYFKFFDKARFKKIPETEFN